MPDEDDSQTQDSGTSDSSEETSDTFEFEDDYFKKGLDDKQLERK